MICIISLIIIYANQCCDRLLLLFLVSAFWHGIRTGYYFSFMTTLISTIGQDRFLSNFSPYFRGSISSKIFYCIAHFLTVRLYEYSSLGFILLDFGDSVSVTASFYYWGHIYAIAMIVLGFFMPSPKRVHEKKVN